MSIYTEAEARKKWCPWARVEIEPGPTCNQFDPAYDPCCIVSECIMWQVVPAPGALTKVNHTDKTSTTPPLTHGYCGKVRKP